MAQGDKFTREKWNTEYVQPHNNLVQECGAGTQVNEAPEHHRWSKQDDVAAMRDSLVEICPDNAALFDSAFEERLSHGRWSNLVLERLKQAIDNGCCNECCWEIFADVNVTFDGNLTPNPQTISLTTPASCDATEATLVDMLSDALVGWLAENMDIISNLEGFNIEATGQVSISQSPGGPGCVFSFQGPVIES